MATNEMREREGKGGGEGSELPTDSPFLGS
jgi:hypothetical protein